MRRVKYAAKNSNEDSSVALGPTKEYPEPFVPVKKRKSFTVKMDQKVQRTM